MAEGKINNNKIKGTKILSLAAMLLVQLFYPLYLGNNVPFQVGLFVVRLHSFDFLDPCFFLPAVLGIQTGQRPDACFYELQGANDPFIFFFFVFFFLNYEAHRYLGTTAISWNIIVLSSRKTSERFILLGDWLLSSLIKEILLSADSSVPQAS